MSTRRMIASDIWRDDFVCSLNWFERLLWIGLVTTCADDQGRLANRPKFILSDIFPNDDAVSQTKVEVAMQTFAKAGKIIQYELDGIKLVQITKWWEYQCPSWAAKSKYPAPKGWTDRVKIHIKDNKVYSENWNSPGGYCVHTPVPTPVHTGIEEVKGEVKGEGEPPPTTAFSSSSPDIQAERIFAAVTGFPTFPGTGRDDAIAAINALKNRHGDELVAYLKPYWLACKKRYPGNVRVFWLTDWAIAGVIPDGKKPQPEGPDLSKWSPA